MTTTTITFQGQTFRARWADRGTLLVMLGRRGRSAAEFLGKRLKDSEGGAWVVHTAQDPYAYPFVPAPHPNQGAFVALDVVAPGEPMPEPQLLNTDPPRRWGR